MVRQLKDTGGLTKTVDREVITVEDISGFRLYFYHPGLTRGNVTSFPLNPHHCGEVVTARPVSKTETHGACSSVSAPGRRVGR